MNGTKSSETLHSDLREGGHSDLGVIQIYGSFRFRRLIQIQGDHSDLGGHSDWGVIQI